MKLTTFLITLSLLVGCRGGGGGSNGSSSSSSGSILGGVAATGAPISGGNVEVKGSDGDTANTTTNADGSYSVDVADLESPYLVRVIAQSGEKYISVASESDLEDGNPVNITPLTHVIVANVFGAQDTDQLYSDFETEADDFTEEKLDDEKAELVQKFIAAGLLGDGKIADEDIDLMNGAFVAGTSEGVDGLLDVIQVNTDAAAGIEIKLKGASSAIITDKVDGTADPDVVEVTPLELDLAVEQLSVIDAIRTRMNNLATLHSSLVSCNGAPVDDGSACDLDTLHATFSPFFHTLYQEEGSGRDEAIWGWFCRLEEDDEAESKPQCLASGTVSFENVSLKDITLLRYDDSTDTAVITFNFYKDGVLRGQEEMTLKLEAGLYNLMGDTKTFEYWIDTESSFKTTYNKATNTGDDSYSVDLKFYFDDDKSYTFAEGNSFTLTADSGHEIFPGNQSSMTLYLVRAPVYSDGGGSCTPGVAFSTSDTPYKVFDYTTGVESYGNFATACAFTSDPCDCRPTEHSQAYFHHEVAQKVTLGSEQIALMDKVETISLSGSGVTGDKFTIKKPLVINQYNAAQYMPSIGMTAGEYCESVNFSTSLNLSVNTGTINYVSLNLGFSNVEGTVWGNESESENLYDSDSTTYVFAPEFSDFSAGDVINYTGLYISSSDEFERQFVREIRCDLMDVI